MSFLGDTFKPQHVYAETEQLSNWTVVMWGPGFSPLGREVTHKPGEDAGVTHGVADVSWRHQFELTCSLMPVVAYRGILDTCVYVANVCTCISFPVS